MGGKTGTTASNVSIPPEILARYNSVNARAEQVAQTPFQNYSTDPNAFVAPLTGTQQAGIANTNNAAGIAQPYFGAATQAYGQGMGAALPFTMAGGQAVNPSNMDSGAINKYMSPYLNTVLGTTMAAQGEQNAQQRSAMQGNAISAGAFGGDRAGIGQANLAYQQNLSNNQTIANILNQGYGQALSTAQQQQGVGLSADQANRAASQGTGQALFNQFTGYGQGLAALGSGAQQAGLMGAGAQLQAGQFEQQTGQAGLSALYNQYLQERSYPFQTTQFLGNLAMGTGALSGSNTTTTQPTPFFSDARLKENMAPIGETYDGQKIVKFNYKGQKQKQIGLVAQDVERHHPDAVGQSHGFKTVDYDAATEESARRAPRYQGGLAPVVSLDDYRAERAGGGLVSDIDLQRMAADRERMYASLPGGGAGPYGGSPNATPRGASPGIVPPGNLPVPKLVTAASPPRPPQSGMSQFGEAVDAAGKLEKVYDLGNRVFGSAERPTAKTTAKKPPAAAPAAPTAAPAAAPTAAPTAAPAPPAAPPAAATTIGALPGGNSTVASLDTDIYQPTLVAAGGAIGGGLVPRHGYQTAGEVEDPQSPQNIYEPENGPGLNIPQMNSTPKLPAPPAAPASASASSGGGDAALKLISTAATIAAMFMSDKRLKENIQPVGKTFDGQNIYKYNFKGDPKTQIGLIAQEVQRRHPDAVGKFNGFKTVDYDSATKDAADRGHFYGGGLVPRQGYQRAGEVVDTGNFDTGPELDPGYAPAVAAGLGAAAPEAPATAPARPPADHKTAFVAQNMPHAMRVSQETGLDPRLILAHAASESDWGRRAPGNNYFGIKSHGVPGGNTLATTEFVNGQPERQQASFRAYESPEQSFSDYGRFLRENPRYAPVLSARGLDAQISAMGKSGYATDPRFEATLASIARGLPGAEGLAAATAPSELTPAAPRASGLSGAGAPARLEANILTTAEEPTPTDRQGGYGNMRVTQRDAREPNWIDRHRDWLLPALGFVGSAASSNSRYLGAALLQGALGAAAGMTKASELEMAQQDRDTAAATQNMSADSVGLEQLRTQALIARGAVEAMKLGFVPVIRNGRYVSMPADQFVRAVRAGENIQIAPSNLPNIPTPVSGQGPGSGNLVEPVAAPAAPPASAVPPVVPAISAAPPAAPASSAAPPPLWRALTPDVARRATQAAEGAISMGHWDGAAPPTAVQNPFDDIEARRISSNQNQTNRISQMGALAEAAASGGQGPFGATVAKPMLDMANSLIGFYGGKTADQLFDPSKYGAMTEAQKLSTLMAANSQMANQSRAWQEMAAFLQATPNPAQDVNGMRRVMSGVMVEMQRAKDLGDFAQNWRDTIQTAYNNPGLYKYTGSGMENTFQSRHADQYEKDKIALIKVMEAGVRIADPSAPNRVRTIPLATFIAQNGIGPTLKEQLSKQYGPEILRYFGVQPNG